MDPVDEYNESILDRGKKLRWKPKVATRKELPEQPKDRTACFVEDENTLFVFNAAVGEWDQIPLSGDTTKKAKEG